MANSSKPLHIGLWVAQIALAFVFIMAGASKLFRPINDLAEMLPWVTSVPAAMVRFIGLSELLGGLGLILPAALRIKPVLTPYAAFGLVLVMLLAVGFHISRGEASVIGLNFGFMALAIFIGWGRMKKAVITSK